MTKVNETSAVSRLSLVGQLVVAAPHVDSLPFRKSVILVVQHREEGSVGLILHEEFRQRLMAGATPPPMPNGRLTAAQIAEVEPQLFSGVVIWPAMHLERDVNAGLWLVTPASFEMAFIGNDLWVDLVRQVGRSVLRAAGIHSFPRSPYWN